MDIRFMNVDLAIESRRDLAPLLDHLGEDVMVLHRRRERGYYWARLEMASSGLPHQNDPGPVIDDFCLLIESLSEETRAVWDSCCRRVFDVGFESGDARSSFESEIRPNTIERMAQLNASLVITIYPPDREDRNGAPEESS